MIAWGDMDPGQGNDGLVNLSQGYESADNSSARGTDHRSATCVELKSNTQRSLLAISERLFEISDRSS
jgi:hypothetical protein